MKEFVCEAPGPPWQADSLHIYPSPTADRFIAWTGLSCVRPPARDRRHVGSTGAVEQVRGGDLLDDVAAGGFNDEDSIGHEGPDGGRDSDGAGTATAPNGGGDGRIAGAGRAPTSDHGVLSGHLDALLDDAVRATSGSGSRLVQGWCALATAGVLRSLGRARSDSTPCLRARSRRAAHHNKVMALAYVTPSGLSSAKAVPTNLRNNKKGRPK